MDLSVNGADGWSGWAASGSLNMTWDKFYHKGQMTKINGMLAIKAGWWRYQDVTIKQWLVDSDGSHSYLL